MFQLDFKDQRPLYEQIKEKVKVLIISGALKPNERIPSVRELAQLLTINPNTIQKAYKDLESEGFIYSVRAKGNFVTPVNNSLSQTRKDELLGNLEKIIAELIFINVTREQVVSYVNDIYRKRGLK